MYQPAEDSYFMSEVLKDFIKSKDKNMNILDMGSGSGIISETCLSLKFKNITAADIDKETIKYLKSKLGKQAYVIQSDLFSKIQGKFDLIIFNPPYLPEDKHDKRKDTTAGKKGYELIIKFLKQSKSYLSKKGKILLLFSSFSKPEKILKEAENLNYQSKLIARKSLFFEKLFIYEFS